MRDSFARGITELVKEDKKIVLLSGDIGNRMFDNFKKPEILSNDLSKSINSFTDL